MECYLIHSVILFMLHVLLPTQHPLVHPIKEVYYSLTHEKLIIVQMYRKDGSLKDLIYKVKIHSYRLMIDAQCTQMNGSTSLSLS